MTAPSESERAEAMAWLDELAGGSDYSAITHHVHTLKAMLAEPWMPEEPTPEMLRVMRVVCEDQAYTPARTASEAYRALRAELMRPKPDYYSTVGEKSGVTREVVMAVLRAAANVSRAAETQSPFSVSLRRLVK